MSGFGACGDGGFAALEAGFAPALRSGFLFVANGNSIPAGQDVTPGAGASGNFPAWPSQIQTMMTASDPALTGIVTTVAHPGWTTPQIATAALTDVDPLYDPKKFSVIIFEEIINDLYFGATAAQAIADLIAYCAARKAVGWTVLVVEPTPRANPGTPSDYEANRQIVVAYMRANWQTFCDGLVATGDDPRIGVAGACNDAFYYFIDTTPGAQDTAVHPLGMGHCVIASLIMNAVRTLFPAKFPWIPQHTVGLNSWYVVSSAKNGSGQTPTNGQNVATWPNAATFSGGDATVGGTAQTYNTTGFGGLPAINAAGGHWMAGGNIYAGRGTIILTAKPNLGGGGVIVATYSTRQWQLNCLEDNTHASNWAAADYVTGFDSLKSAAVGSLIDGSAHVYTLRTDGTDAGLKMRKDGVAVTLTTYTGGGTFNTDSGSTLDLVAVHIGGDGRAGAASFAGLLGEVATMLPLTDAELHAWEVYLGGLRGITVT